MDRLEADERAPGEPAATPKAMTLADWQSQDRPEGCELCLRCDDDLAGEYTALARARRITVEFPVFTDGRGFSHAQRLRANGFRGELLAAGDVLPDQWSYLERCGFSDLADGNLRRRSATLPRFRNAYQADAVSPYPAFARR